MEAGGIPRAYVCGFAGIHHGGPAKGLTRHVGAGHEVEAGAVGEVGVVGLEGVLRRRLRHRVPPAYNGDRPCAHLVGSFRQSPSQPLAATAAEASA